MDTLHYLSILKDAYATGALGAAPGFYAVDLAFRQQMTYARVNGTTAALEAARTEFTKWIRETQ